KEPDLEIERKEPLHGKRAGPAVGDGPGIDPAVKPAVERSQRRIGVEGNEERDRGFHQREGRLKQTASREGIEKVPEVRGKTAHPDEERQEQQDGKRPLPDGEDRGPELDRGKPRLDQQLESDVAHEHYGWERDHGVDDAKSEEQSHNVTAPAPRPNPATCSDRRRAPIDFRAISRVYS